MKIISFEGNAGAGKSTLIDNFERHLSKKGVKVYKCKPIRKHKLEAILKTLNPTGDIEKIWTTSIPKVNWKAEIAIYMSLLMCQCAEIEKLNCEVILIDRYLETLMGLVYHR